MAEIAPVISTKPRISKVAAEAFVYGFMSTVGIMAAVAIYQNRQAIKANARTCMKVWNDAISEAR